MYKRNARYNFFRGQWWPIVLLIMMLIGTNSAVFFAGRTLLPITIAPGVVPSFPYGYEGPTPDWTTTLDPYAAFDACFAADAYSVSTILQGIFPFWNPYQGLGQPHLANGFSAVLYPANWLHLILPPAWWDMVYLLNWLLAAVFLFRYLRLMGVEAGPSLVAGAAIFGSGYFQFLLPLREVLAVAAWWPLLLYCVERAIREPNWRARHWLLPFSVYCSIAGGQPEVTFMGLFVVLVYASVRLATQAPVAWRGFLAIAPGSMAGLLLAAPVWIPFVSYAFTNYSHHPGGSPIGQFHLGFKTLITYFFPYVYGRLHFNPYGPIAGWNWDLSPGWFSAMGLFLALASISSLKKKPKWGQGFLWATSGVIIAKIWGVPGVNLLGRLPLFERVFFGKFAGFLPAIGLAGLAAYGMSALFKLEARKWILWLMAWFVLVAVILIMGIVPIWPALKQGNLVGEPLKTLLLFGGLGLAWAVLGPVGLWWVKSRCPNKNDFLCSLAACAVLLQGIAYASNGYSFRTYGLLSIGCLMTYLFLALGIGFVQKVRLNRSLIGLEWVLVALPPLLGACFASNGLPSRYNPLTPAPYLGTLGALQGNNLYRSYSLDSTPQPNFAAPFGLTSLDNLEALSPIGSAEFMQRYLDRGVFPIWFAGNHSAARNPEFTAIGEFFENKRYFDLVGVRYLVTIDTEPIPVLYCRKGSHVPLALDQPLEASFSCPTDSLTAIEVMLSTYGRKNPGIVALSVFAPDGTPLGRASIASDGLCDNSFQGFCFTPINGFKDKQIGLLLEFRPEQTDSMIAAWKFPEHPDWGFVFRVRDTTKKLPLIYYDDATGVHIWENRQANPRVFLAPTAKVTSCRREALARLPNTSNLIHQVWVDQGPGMESKWPDEKTTGHPVSFRLGPNDVWIKYRADTSGILTLTDSYLKGWRAELNGQEVPVLRVDGAFRGVRIKKPGIYHVHFWYRPPYWNLSLGMAGVGLLLATGGTLLSSWEKGYS